MADGLAKAMDGHFDLYLLDYYLPDGTGLELCHLIRAFDSNTPIFFCTHASSISMPQIEAARAQGLIRKGYGFVEWLELAASQILS